MRQRSCNIAGAFKVVLHLGLEMRLLMETRWSRLIRRQVLFPVGLSQSWHFFEKSRDVTDSEIRWILRI